MLPLTRLLIGNAPDQTTSLTSHDDWIVQRLAPLSELNVVQRVTAVEPLMRILAVDDDPFILELIPKISAKAGFSAVMPAASGHAALELLVSSDMIFDCLLLDISMPGMDGIELCRRVRQMPQYQHTPIIMLTAMRDLEHMSNAYRAGANDYATKPFDIEELGNRLRAAQESVQARRELHRVTQQVFQPHRQDSMLSHSVELPDELHLQNVRSLVDFTSLSSYLTQLSRKDVANVRLFAVTVDGVEAVYRQSSARQFVALLEDLASEAVGCFGADQTVMAYTKDATLLVATNFVNPPSALDIERRLHGNLSEYGSASGTGGIGVSVGGPVKPQGAKADRARMTTDLVIAFAENRSLDKQGGQIAGLFRR